MAILFTDSLSLGDDFINAIGTQGNTLLNFYSLMQTQTHRSLDTQREGERMHEVFFG